ncbi:hypothetical protein [Achromobacter xylosoxidans]|uniref:hypothetical protein n=1 Tax=Alcaligenes xylosoxydans xylosoxydans TaxID=85698 RepID=UPI00106076D9|nr:hypothetical protein [Achromobacter xylosoxidans]BEG73907.1 hypothetical protein HBIAX_00952 [Achromobacter xylosoxidans]
MGADPIRVAVKAVGSFLARFTTPFPCQLHKFLGPHSFVLQYREKREIVQKIWRVVLRTYRRNAVFLWMALLYTAFVALPSGYAYFVKFPAAADLHLSEGLAQFKYDLGRGHELVLNGEVYTCGGPFLKANTDCLQSREDRNRLEGKLVSVTWFYQAMYPFIESRRIVDIAYDGKLLLPGDCLGKQLRKDRERSKRLMLLGFVVFFLAVFMRNG